MIAEFAVENFFSIKEVQRISFEPTSDAFMSDEYTCEIKEGTRLLKIGIIYGANASGKSNVLNAIDFFRSLVLRMPKNRNEETGVVPFMLDDVSRNEKTRMSMAFYINQSKYVLGFELDEKYIYSETLIVYDSIRPAKLYSRSYDASTDSTSIEFGANLKMTKKSQDVISGNTINNCSVLAAFGKSNVERTKLNDVYDYFANQVKIEDFSLHEDERLITSEMERLIQNAPIGEQAKSEMLGRGKITNMELTFTHKAGTGLYELPEEFESNGTMRFLGMAVILNFLLKTNRFMPIDEIETSIHYELLAYFLKVFLASSNGTSQMLLTTHDINLLNEDFIRRDTIWFTDKDEYGQTKIVRLSSLGLHKNLSPYNAYRQGKLVKLPFLESQYINLDD